MLLHPPDSIYSKVITIFFLFTSSNVPASPLHPGAKGKSYIQQPDIQSTVHSSAPIRSHARNIKARQVYSSVHTPRPRGIISLFPISSARRCGGGRTDRAREVKGGARERTAHARGRREGTRQSVSPRARNVRYTRTRGAATRAKYSIGISPSVRAHTYIDAHLASGQ